MTDTLLADVKVARERTVARGTARMSYAMDVPTTGLSKLADFLGTAETDPPVSGWKRQAWSLVGEGVKAGDRVLSRLATGVGEGTIDFASGSALYTRESRGKQHSVFAAAGVRLSRDGDQGPWLEGVRRDGAISSHSPMWFIEVLRAPIAAELVADDELVAGVVCRHLRVTVDEAAADELSAHRVEFRQTLKRERLRDLGQPATVEVWIDADGLLRRARHAQPVVPMTTTLELWDFGIPDPLAVPSVDPDAPANRRAWPLLAGMRIVEDWAQRAPEVIPSGTVTVRGTGVAVGLRNTRSGDEASNPVVPAIALALPGTREHRLERAYRALGDQLQEAVSGASGQPWPGPDPRTNVRVGPEQIEVWWSSAQGSSPVALTPIDRAKIQ